MRTAIIGCGHIATVHGPAILKQPAAQIVGVSDPDPARAKRLADMLHLDAGLTYTDPRIMLKEQHPTVVHVLTPPQYHAEFSIMAMQNGCHVLVEKPMALTLNDAEEMARTAEQNNVYLCVNHNMIFEPLVKHAIALSKTIGTIVSLEAHDNFNPYRLPAILEEGAELCHWAYRLNGGPLQDLMPHHASFMMEFMPQILDVHTIVQNNGILPTGWPDEIRVMLNSGSVSGYISISCSMRPDATTLVVRGTHGTIVADLFSNVLTVQRTSSLPRFMARCLSGFQTGFQYLRGATGNILKIATGRHDKSRGIAAVISGFYEAITSGSAPPIELRKALDVVKLTETVWPAPPPAAPKTHFPPVRKAGSVSRAVLVTGASGFIGTHLVSKLLEEGNAVRALVRPNSPRIGRLLKRHVDIIEGDLSDPGLAKDAAKGARIIYHAGAATACNSWQEYHETNIKGTEYLLNAARENKVERFVHLSTLNVYDLVSAARSGSGAIVRESTPYHKNPDQMGHYAKSKIEADKLLLDAHHDAGLPVTILRLGLVIGPLGPVFFPHLGYRYNNSLVMTVGKGDSYLPFVYIDNAIQGIIHASTAPAAVGKIYNLVDDDRVTVQQYLELMQQAGIKLKIIHLPYYLPYLGTSAYEFAYNCGILRNSRTSRRQLKQKATSVQFDTNKAHNDFGYKSSVPLADGLTKTFEWYVNKHRL